MLKDWYRRGLLLALPRVIAAVCSVGDQQVKPFAVQCQQALVTLVFQLWSQPTSSGFKEVGYRFQPKTKFQHTASFPRNDFPSNYVQIHAPVLQPPSPPPLPPPAGSCVHLDVNCKVQAASCCEYWDVCKLLKTLHDPFG